MLVVNDLKSGRRISCGNPTQHPEGGYPRRVSARYNSRRGQMEIMGLAIIVILISLAMLFVIRFVVLKEPSEFKQEFTQSQLASNTLNTLMKTTNPGCHDLTFSEIFKNCARSLNPTVDCSAGVNTCQYLDAEVQGILDGVLADRGISYYFHAETRLGDVNPVYGEPCPAGFKRSTRPEQVDPAGALTLTLTLDICD